MLNQNKNYVKDIIAVIAIAVSWVLFFIISGCFSNYYQIYDAHLNLELIEKMKAEGLGAGISYCLEYYLTHRFLPLYSVFRPIMVYAFGQNWTLYYVFYMILAVLTSSLFYAFARLNKLSIASSLFFVFFLFIGSESWFNQATIYFRIASAELPGMFLLGAAMVFAELSARKKNVINKYELGFVLFLVVCTLVKESFIVAVPAFVFWKLYRYGQHHNVNLIQSIKKHLVLLASLAVVVIIELLIIIFVIGTNKMGYVGVFNLKETIVNFVSMTLGLLRNDQLIALTFIVFLVAIGIKSAAITKGADVKTTLTTFFKENWAVLALFILIALPQLVLYAKSGLYERFKFPLFVGLAFFFAYYLNIILKKDNRYIVVKVLLVGLLLINVYYNTRNSIANARSYSVDGNKLTGLLNQVKPNADEKVLVLVDPVLSYEWGISMTRYIQFVNVVDDVQVVSASIGHNERLFSNNDPEYHAFLKKLFEDTMADNIVPNTDSTAKYKYIVYSLEEMPEVYLENQTWFSDNDYSVQKMTGFYLLTKKQ